MWSVGEELSNIVVGTIVEMDLEVTDGTSKTLALLVPNIMHLSTYQNIFSSDTIKIMKGKETMKNATMKNNSQENLFY